MDKSRDFKEWIRRAEGSLELSKISKTDKILYEDLCFNTQQSVEKALKGLIIRLGLVPPKTHYLNELLQIINKRLTIPYNVKVCAKLNNYAVTTRYPDDYYEITEQEYKEAVEIAENVFNWVVENIK